MGNYSDCRKIISAYHVYLQVFFLWQHVQSYILDMHRIVFHGEGAVVEGISEHQTATVVTAVQVPKMIV